jgi:hypothetical protein
MHECKYEWKEIYLNQEKIVIFSLRKVDLTDILWFIDPLKIRIRNA